MITTLPEQIAALPSAMRAVCERLFLVTRSEGQASIPEPMRPWVTEHFGDPTQVSRQTIIRVVNRLTLEAALFNPLRARRPGGNNRGHDGLDTWLAEEAARGDMFTTPYESTTADLFGRIQGRYCVSASNVAKYDSWHGLVIFDEPNPLQFDIEQVADYVDVALRWLAAAQQMDDQAIYPMIVWNCLPRSGATIAHGHMQMSLARDMHYARPELWRRAALAYGGVEQYFDDLAAIHHELGLALPSGKAFAHLTPLRNREIIALLPDTPPTALAINLAEIIAPVLRTFIDHEGMQAFNVGIALPPGDADPAWRGMPVIARIADRSPALNIRNDWGAMELFATGCITIDPFVTAETVRRVEG